MNKKGFSIVEAVIAMAVIAIVTATALTIVSNSFDNTKAAMYKADAQYLVYDALECFKTSTNADDFSKSFSFRGNVTKLDNIEGIVSPFSEGETPAADPGEGGETPEEGEGENANDELRVFMINESNYFVFVIMKYNYSEDGKPSVFTYDKFSIIVTDSDSNTVASIVDYRKLHQ